MFSISQFAKTVSKVKVDNCFEKTNYESTAGKYVQAARSGYTVGGGKLLFVIEEKRFKLSSAT